MLEKRSDLIGESNRCFRNIGRIQSTARLFQNMQQHCILNILGDSCTVGPVDGLLESPINHLARLQA